MFSDRLPGSLKQVLRAREFFHRFPDTHCDVSAGGSQMVIDTGRSERDICLPIREDIIQTLYADSEILQLKNHPHRLAIYNNWLLWFKETEDPLISPPGSTQMLLGYANLVGATVDPIAAGKSRLFQSNATAVSSPTKPAGGFKITLRNEDADWETLIFESEKHTEKWRAKLSEARVFFTDFGTRYKTVRKVAKEGRTQILYVENKQTFELLVARAYTLSATESTRDIGLMRQKFLDESDVMLRLRGANITAKFRELCFTERSCLILEEPLEAVRFAEWFTGTWCYEGGTSSGQPPILKLFTDLAFLVYNLHKNTVCHGQITKDAFLVKPSKRSTKPKVKLQKNPLKGVKTSLQSISYDRSGRSSQQLPSVEDAPSPRTDHQAKEIRLLSDIRRRPCLATTEYLENEESDSMTKEKGWKFYITNLGLATKLPNRNNDGMRTQQDKYQYFDRSDSPNSSLSLKGVSLEDDVFALGCLMFEILFGIDVSRGLAQENGLETQYVASLLKQPRTVIHYKEPLYEIDETVVILIGRMLDPDKDQRPSIRDCYAILQNVETNPTRLAKSTKRLLEWKTGMFSMISLDSHYPNRRITEKERSAEQKWRKSGDYPISITELKSPPIQSQQRTVNSVSVGTNKVSVGANTSMRLVQPSAQKLKLATPSGQLMTPSPKIGGILGRKPSLNGVTHSVDLLKSQSWDLMLKKYDIPDPHRWTRSRNSSLVPLVCILARESFKVENKPKKVVLPTGHSSADSSIYEQADKTPLNKEGPSIIPFTIPKQSSPQRYKLDWAPLFKNSD